eukprot:m.76556 g.76556  ORF g.76556 m.76556 type:complete len:435 (-) comp14033_c0_seq3:1913-3217(-)
MFNGGRRKRAVDLGGRRVQQQTPADARAQRMQRMRERQEQEAALRLQEWWKGAHARLQQHAALEQELHQLFKEPVETLMEPAALKHIILLALVTQYRRKTPKAELLDQLSARVSNPKLRDSLLAVFAQPRFGALLVRCLFELLLRQAPPFPDAAAGLLVSLLSLQQPHVQRNVISAFDSRQTHVAIAAHCLHDGTSARAIIALLSCLAVALKAGSTVCSDYFLAEILSRQLPSRIISLPFMAGLILRQLNSPQLASLPKDPKALIYLAENITNTVLSKGEHLTATGFATYANIANQVLTSLHADVLFACHEDLAMDTSDDESADEDAEERVGEQFTLAGSRQIADEDLLSRLRKIFHRIIDIFSSPQNIKHTISSFETKPTPAPTSIATTSDDVHSIVAIYARIVALLRSASDAETKASYLFQLASGATLFSKL